MICSPEDAKSLLRKWLDEESDLSCVFWDFSLGATPKFWFVHGRCWIEEASETLVLGFSEESAFRVLLSSALGFEFNTVLDVKSLPSTDLSKHGSWLTIHLPNNLRVLVGERKTSQALNTTEGQ